MSATPLARLRAEPPHPLQWLLALLCLVLALPVLSIASSWLSFDATARETLAHQLDTVLPAGVTIATESITGTPSSASAPSTAPAPWRLVHTYAIASGALCTTCRVGATKSSGLIREMSVVSVRPKPCAAVVVMPSSR